MRFQYFEIRACVEKDGATLSFKGEPVYCPSRDDYIHTPAGAEAEALAANAGWPFWTLYGIDQDGTAVAVGDFKTFEAAEEVMDAILTPMLNALDWIVEHWNADRAATELEDFINQCTNSERL